MEEIKEGDVVEVKIPSTTGEVTVVAYVLDIIWSQVGDNTFYLDYIMYSQNRLFRMHGFWQHHYDREFDYDEVLIETPEYSKIILDYVVLPEIDNKLAEIALSGK